ncbi:hypothetical protein KFK09_014169 [Dendrobium nobile]|uniref:Uncharacterized protein n=1 Tax=Dendrobium nobile TaxID=94219 RepID=A0A8T3BAY3_DENNO|nr:hypothetical protein KFK09_014169 [Dendrobium nobile]
MSCKRSLHTSVTLNKSPNIITIFATIRKVASFAIGLIIGGASRAVAGNTIGTHEVAEIVEEPLLLLFFLHIKLLDLLLSTDFPYFPWLMNNSSGY